MIVEIASAALRTRQVGSEFNPPVSLARYSWSGHDYDGVVHLMSGANVGAADGYRTLDDSIAFGRQRSAGSAEGVAVLLENGRYRVVGVSEVNHVGSHFNSGTTQIVRPFRLVSLSSQLAFDRIEGVAPGVVAFVDGSVLAFRTGAKWSVRDTNDAAT